jgi:hypothetical protein
MGVLFAALTLSLLMKGMAPRLRWPPGWRRRQA